MADKLLSELTEKTALESTDLVYLQSGETGRRATVKNFGQEITGVVNVKRDFDATLDGLTDGSTKLQAAIDADDGDVIVDGDILAIGSTVTLKSNVKLRLNGGAQIKWIGAAGGTMFDTPVTDVLVNTGIVGGQIDMVDAGFLLDAHSMVFSEFGDLHITGTRTTSTVFRLSADSTAGAGPTSPSNRHFAWNHFHDIIHSGTNCGTLFHLRLNNAGTQRLFQNMFGNISADACNADGFIIEGGDNNIGYGPIRIEIIADNTKALVLKQDATASIEAEENLFQYFSGESFSNLPGTNRISVSLEDAASRNHIFRHVHGGTGITQLVSVGANVAYYSIMHTSSSGAPPTLQGAGSGEMLRLIRTGGTAQLALKNSSGTVGSLGEIHALGLDSAGAEIIYADILGRSLVETAGSEDGEWRVRAFLSGTKRDFANFGPNGFIGIGDGITPPSFIAGIAYIYVDTADGDLKVKFGDGVVKTIATDT